MGGMTLEEAQKHHLWECVSVKFDNDSGNLIVGLVNLPPFIMSKSDIEATMSHGKSVGLYFMDSMNSAIREEIGQVAQVKINKFLEDNT